jgi:hypothetical protein
LFPLHLIPILLRKEIPDAAGDDDKFNTPVTILETVQQGDN